MLETVISLLAIGYASAYSPGVFERVIDVRQRGLTSYTLPDTIELNRYIAVEDCSMVGKEAMVFFGDESERVLIADCAGVADGGKAWMQHHNIAGELDWETFSEYKQNEPLEIRVYLIEESLKFNYQ